MELKHIPVLVEEVMACLNCLPHQTYVDATLGGGGHAIEILERTAPDGRLIGVEWDEDAISEAKNRLAPFTERVTLFHENYAQLPELLKAMNIEQVDGILLDLGLSSIQLEEPERGFSFKGQGPLDMRMDRRRSRMAADLVNRLPPKDLEQIIFEYGEERWARRIAKSIVFEREKSPIRTTEELRKIVYRAIPGRFRSRRIDPSTRTFQAFRIAVNEELKNLKEILEVGWRLLKKGGRMCVISFHSLEDRMVKEAFRRLAKGEADSSGQGAVMRVITKKPVTPSEEECARNPRSRSAKLRCAERV
jgi:16S rRNA (cytosine1402-N4)-methyltransferase